MITENIIDTYYNQDLITYLNMNQIEWNYLKYNDKVSFIRITLPKDYNATIIFNFAIEFTQWVKEKNEVN